MESKILIGIEEFLFALFAKQSLPSYGSYNVNPLF